jgi:hypothetical protein
VGADWGQQGAHPFAEVSAPPPEKGRSWTLIAAVGGLVAIGVLVAGYVLLFAGAPAPSASPIAVSPTPSGSATASPSATGGSPLPTDVTAQIDAVVEQMPATRELAALEKVPFVLLTRDEARIELEALAREELDLVALEAEERLLRRLGLLAEDDDALLDLLIELQGAAVAAYYRTDTGTMYIIERDEPFSSLDKVFVAHEYTHALQDQHFDLEGNRITDLSEGDAVIAQLAAIEGDASLAMLFWAFANLNPAEQLELLADMSPTDQQLLEEMPPILRRQLTFPYNEGVAFSSDIYALGGWEAINETITAPPLSTEQVLHPQKYRDGEAPIDVEPTDWREHLGPGWQIAYEQTMGELNTQIWLADGAEPPLPGLPGLPGLPAEPEPWQEAAAGWGGDRLRMYEQTDGRWAIVWETEWDSDADEEEFVQLAEPLLEGLGHPAFVIGTRPGLTSAWVAVASDEQVLETFFDLAQP